MSTRIDQFCDRLRERLDAVDNRLQSVWANVRALRGRAEEGLHDDLAAARSKVDSQVVQVEQAGDGVKAWAASKVAETREMISDWKAKRETRKLTVRSDRAEAYASNAIFLAAAAVDEADAAIREAALAHLDAEVSRTV
jgi:hypothetical protein